MWGVCTFTIVSGFSLDDGRGLGICVCFFTPLASCSHCSSLQGADGSPFSRCSSLAASAALCLGHELQPWAASANTESGGAAGKAITWKGQWRVGRGSPSPRLVLFENCLAHFFYFSKHEVSLSFYSLSCLLSTTSNQMGSRDKTIKTQCLYLAGCQVCMPSKYLRQKNLNRQYLL